MKNFKKITKALKRPLISCFTAILLLIGILAGAEKTQPENPQETSAVMLCGENPLNDVNNLD